MSKSSFPGFFPRLPSVAAVIVAALLVADAGHATADKDVDAPVRPGASAIGNYLAGRHAQVRRDMEAAVIYLNAALRAMPDAPDLRRRTFILRIIEGQIEDALPLARELLKDNPKAPIANLTLAVEALRRGDHAALMERFADGADRGLNSFTQPLLEAWSLAGQGQLSPAITALDKLDGKESTQGLHDVHEALLYDFMGDPKAEMTYQALAEKDLAGSFRIVQHMGHFYERRGETAKARAVYDKLREDLPGTNLLDVADARLKAGRTPAPLLRAATDGAAEALFSIANSLRRQRARETALVLARLALYLRPDFPIALVLVADILEDDSRYADSNAVYARVDERSPYRAAADLNRARNLDSLDRTDEAIALYRDVASRRSHDPQPMTQLGNLLRRHERWSEAVEAYTGAIERVGLLEKRHWRMLYARGVVLERAKRWPEAEKDFLKALEFEPDQPFVLNYLGYSWIDQGVNLERAQDMIRRAVELRPNDGYIIDSLGWGYYRLGKFEDAVRELERAIQIRPEDPVINDHLGDAYWRVGRKLEAEFQWRRALSLKPEEEAVAKIRKKLDDGLGPDEFKPQVPAENAEPIEPAKQPALKKI